MGEHKIPMRRKCILMQPVKWYELTSSTCLVNFQESLQPHLFEIFHILKIWWINTRERLILNWIKMPTLMLFLSWIVTITEKISLFTEFPFIFENMFWSERSFVLFNKINDQISSAVVCLFVHSRICLISRYIYVYTFHF